MMNDDQLLRYNRHILLPEVDIDGQEAILQARVLIIGLGGLGCPAALYLGAAGVGHLVLNDFDTVELSNLQRQVAHGTADIGQNKAASAAASVAALNPDCQVTILTEKLSSDQLQTQVEAATVVLDCSDNFDTRFLVNRLCVAAQTPLVSGAAIRFDGQLLVVEPGKDSAPCYQCLYQPEAADESAQLSCSQSGVLSPLVGMIGSMQALETLKLLSAAGRPASGKLLVIDGLTMEVRTLGLKRNPQCPVCGAQ